MGMSMPESNRILDKTYNDKIKGNMILDSLYRESFNEEDVEDDVVLDVGRRDVKNIKNREYRKSFNKINNVKNSSDCGN